MRLIFAELGAPSISSSFPIPKVHEVFDENGKLIDQRYEKMVKRFLDEFEWYMERICKMLSIMFYCFIWFLSKL
jgi:hypothetical protein